MSESSNLPSRQSWWKRETPVPNWALVCFLVLTINGLVELISRVF